MNKNCKEICKELLFLPQQVTIWLVPCVHTEWHGQEWHTLGESSQVTYKLEVVLKLTNTPNQTCVVMDALTHLMLAELHGWAGILLFSECRWMNSGDEPDSELREWVSNGISLGGVLLSVLLGAQRPCLEKRSELKGKKKIIWDVHIIKKNRLRKLLVFKSLVWQNLMFLY